MKTEHLKNQNATPGNSHHPSPTRLSEKAFYLIALAILLRRSVEPGSLQRYLVPGNQPVPVRG